jgi:hypothetical protein
MERRARTLSLLVGLFGLTFAGLLTRTSFRGDVVADTSGTREDDRAGTRAQRLADAASFDTTRLLQQIEPSNDSTVDRIAREADSAPDPQEHLQRLAKARTPIGPSELEGQAGTATAYDAVAQLRPYWFEMTDRLVVHAGGQNVGGREALRDIRVGVVREIRLRFAVDEPHWVIEVHLQ